MTVIVGLKLTHDAAVALIDGGQLMFSVEIEKLSNNPRYSKLQLWSQISQILGKHGYRELDVNRWVVDGWKHDGTPTFNQEHCLLAGYHEFDSHGPTPDVGTGLLAYVERESLPLTNGSYPYISYPHIAGHVVGAYAMSPFSATQAPAYVLSWDGGQPPRVHLVDPNGEQSVKFIMQLMPVHGMIYGIMRYYFGPYKEEQVMRSKDNPALSSKYLYGGYDVSGKLMAYAGLGTAHLPMVNALEQILISMDAVGLDYELDGVREHEFMRQALAWFELQNSHMKSYGLTDEDAIASIHSLLQRVLLNRIVEIVPEGSNLIFTGGSALNIKWNSALRDCGQFAQVWVPPCPNDSGSAIGAACCAMVMFESCWALDWQVYSGPRLKLYYNFTGWNCEYKSAYDVGKWLSENEEPILFLHGRAEIGPRALGHRSLLMDPRTIEAKRTLNDLKFREHWRPVAPICLESEAEEWFMPGTPDPYMLFEHGVCWNTVRHAPAVVHEDGTARLQTVSEENDSVIYQVLRGFYEQTDVPMLCNTSANKNGCGFFPDDKSALQWAKERGVHHAYINGLFYTRNIM